MNYYLKTALKAGALLLAVTTVSCMSYVYFISRPFLLFKDCNRLQTRPLGLAQKTRHTLFTETLLLSSNSDKYCIGIEFLIDRKMIS